MNTEYSTALESFIGYAQSLQDTNHPVDVSFEIMTGKVYDRVVQIYGRQRSAFCFVRKSDGAVLKVASWKAPASIPGDRSLRRIRQGMALTNTGLITFDRLSPAYSPFRGL